MKLFSRELSLLISLLILFSIPLFAQTSLPITTPIEWKGLDTLSKFYQFEQFKKQHQPAISENENSRIPFKKDGNDNILDLITDPRVVYSSYFGGNGYDCSYGIAVDSKDNMILVGYSGSTNLPTTAGCFQKEKSGSHDAFIAKFTPDGQPIWITYYGGSGTDVAKGCVIDKDDNIYVVGKTDSPDFPATKGSYKGSSDVFILKFSPTGERLWAELYGSDGFDTGEGIALMSDGGFVVAGYTTGTNLPVSTNAEYKTLQGNADAFISRFSSDGDLIWGTYYGGYQNEITTCIATDKWDNIAVGGYHQTVSSEPGMPIFPTGGDSFQWDTSQLEDGMLIVLSGVGSLKYATLYGGHAKRVEMGDGKDYIYGVTFDSDGNCYCCGYTSSYDFPVNTDAYKHIYDSHDAFILKFSNNFSRVWATFYGGKETDTGDGAQSISCDHNGNLWITGWTNSNSFPVIGDSIHGIDTPGSFYTQIFILKMDLKGKPIYSAYYGHGGSFGYSIYSKNQNIYFTGETATMKFPYTVNAFNKRIVPAEYTSYFTKINLNKTDVIDRNRGDSIEIYPNPVHVYLEITKPSECSSNVVRIFNVFGEIVKNPTQTLPDGEGLRIDVSGLPSGVYFVRMGDRVGKFVKI